MRARSCPSRIYPMSLYHGFAGAEGVADFCKRVGAIAAINGGYFGGATSCSAVVYPGEVKAQNVALLNRDGVIYPVACSFFGISNDKGMSVNWIYHFGASVYEVYRSDPPTPNLTGRMAAVPVKSNGTPYKDLFVGLGGGPDVSKNIFIGPSPNPQLVLPCEVPVKEFFHHSSGPDTIRTRGKYQELLPDFWKAYFPIYEAYHAIARLSDSEGVVVVKGRRVHLQRSDCIHECLVVRRWE